MNGRKAIRIVWMLLFSLVLLPGMIVLGFSQWGNRRHLIVSTLVLAATFFPFLLHFERRKPQARELVLIAVLIAMGVAGRELFVWLPQGKPVAALVLVVGASLGAESGFLTGAAIAFFSNFLFTQGPWTPWQMLAFGSLGLAAGLMFSGRKKAPSRIGFALFGGAAVMILYGGLVDGSTMMMVGDRLTWEMIVTIYTLAIPYNLMHAGATVVFLLLGVLLMFRVLDRIQTKYGFYEETAL